MNRTRLSLLILVALTLLAPTPTRSALVQTYQQTGTLGLEVTGVGGQNQFHVSGNLTLSALPPAAAVQRATLYASQNNNGTNPLTASFNAVPLGAVGPSASDPAFGTLYTYQWDVTPHLLPGLPSHSFSVTETVNGLGIAAVGLVVVWQDAGEPMRTITISEGMKQVGESGPETESHAQTMLPSGITKAWILTCYDDNAATGEVVTYNGAPFGGPIDQNLGFNASVLQMNTTSQSGTNTLAIQTLADHLGWMVAATAVDLAPVSVDGDSWGKIKGRHR